MPDGLYLLLHREAVVTQEERECRLSMDGGLSRILSLG